MRKLFTILLLLITVSAFAQQSVIDTVRYRFSYAIKGTLAETSKNSMMTNLVLILVTALPIATVVGRKTMMNYGRRSRLPEAQQMTILPSKVRQACTTKKTLNIIQIEGA